MGTFGAIDSTPTRVFGANSVPWGKTDALPAKRAAFQRGLLPNNNVTTKVGVTYNNGVCDKTFNTNLGQFK